MSIVSVETLQRLKAKAVASGALPKLFDDDSGVLRRVIEWDVSQDCEKPEIREYSSTVSELVVNRGKRMPIEWVILTVRCRRCKWCLHMRQRLWAGKARSECDAAFRTWFCTFTFAPDLQFQAEARARVLLSMKGVNFDELTQFQQFSERTKILGRELTLFFKRCRKNSSAPIRYLLVAEEHKSGLPHFHALIHESAEDFSLKKEVIEDAWKAGFSKSRLLKTSKGAFYVTKYLSKTMLVRVRASQHYGQKCNDLYRSEKQKF